MKILTEEELVSKLDFMRPLHPPVEETESAWCIPFEYGANGKGTRVSVSKARQIIAELRAEVAEAEKRELYRAFKQEEERSKSLAEQAAKAQEEKFEALGRVVKLTQQIRAMKRKR